MISAIESHPTITTNRRIVIPQHGPPSVLQLIDEPIPQPKKGELRIKVEAAGVSFGDVLQRNGLFFASAPKLPYTPGYDIVGRIDAVGPGVSFKRGERVAAFTVFGGYSEFLCVPEQNVIGGVPEEIGAAEAVALVLNYATAFQMLHRVARVRAGQSVLVYGGSGGVGSALLELAKLARVRVAAAVSVRWQKDFQGKADLLFDEKGEGITDKLRAFAPRGFDAAFDGIGGAHVWRTRSLVAPTGILVPFGIAGVVSKNRGRSLMDVLRVAALLGLAQVIRRPRVKVYAIAQRVKSHRREIHDDIRQLFDLLKRGEISPRIGACIPLAESARAHALLESRQNAGKVVLIP